MADENIIELQLSEFAAYEARDIGIQIMQIIYDEYRKADAVAHGDNGGLISYMNPNGSHWDFVFSDNGQYLIMQIEIPKYWHFLEEGRNPTKQPGKRLYPKILEWIKLKGITPTPRKRIDPKTRKPIGKAYTPSEKQLAYAITKKIHTFGFFGYDAHGKHIMEKAMNKVRSRGLIKELTTAVHNKVGDIVAIQYEELKDIRTKNM